MDAEYGIVGVGTMGAMAAWQLARRGESVLAFDRFAPGHDRSAAGGETRIFRTAYKEGSQYVPLLLHAKDEWRALEADSQRSLLNLTGFLNIADRTTSLAEDVSRCADDYGLPHSVWTGADAAERYPQHVLGTDDTVVLDEYGGYIKPELAVTVAAARAADYGAQIRTYEPVRSIEPDDRGVTIVTDAGSYRVRKAIVTTGPWAPSDIGITAPVIKPYRIVMTWFQCHTPDSFQSAVFPPFVRHWNGHEICGWPTMDGESVKVAMVNPYDEVPDPDHLNGVVEPRLLAEIRDCVAHLLPDLVPDPTRISTHMEGYSEDGHALVGIHGAHSNVILAYGFSGHGFKLSPSIGRAVADLATTGTTDLSIQHLDPARHMPGTNERLSRTVADSVAEASA